MLSQRLRHRVDIEQQVPEFTSYGEEVGHVWEVFEASVPAEVLTGPGREFNAADAKQAETTARVTVRWFPGLLPSMRIIWEGQAFDILSIETDVTARKECRLRLKQGVNDGA